MDNLFPDHGPELRSITQAYLRVRYGELPENVEEVHAVQDAWEDVRAAGRRELLRRKKSQTRDDQIIK